MIQTKTLNIQNKSASSGRKSPAESTLIHPVGDRRQLRHDPLIRIYLAQARVFPLLSRDEERELAEHLERARGKFRRLVLSNDFALQRALQLLSSILRQETRFDHAVDVSIRDSEKKDRIKQAIANNVPKLAQLLAENEVDRALATSCDQAAKDQLNAWRRIRRRRARAVRLVENLCLRVSYIELWWQEIRPHHTSDNTPKDLNDLSPENSFNGEGGPARCQQMGDTEVAFLQRCSRIQEARQTYLRAKRQLASHNLRLVVAIAKRYHTGDLTLLDLIQEGNLGLLIAAEKFEIGRGNKFATYATWWITQMIRKGIVEKSRTVRLPVAASERTDQALRHMNERSQLYGRRLTHEEVEDAARLTEEERLWIPKVLSPMVSLDQSIHGTEDIVMHESLPQYREDPPDESVGKSEIRAILRDILSRWEPREREIIKLRFGLNGRQPRTLEEVGSELQLSRERVRQLEKASLQRLREQLAFVQAGSASTEEVGAVTNSGRLFSQCLAKSGAGKVRSTV